MTSANSKLSGACAEHWLTPASGNLMAPSAHQSQAQVARTHARAHTCMDKTHVVLLPYVWVLRGIPPVHPAGIKTQRATKLAQKLHVHSVQYTQRLTSTRRGGCVTCLENNKSAYTVSVTVIQHGSARHGPLESEILNMTLVSWDRMTRNPPDPH
eukprot:1160393-Pelagomonas_calceolata.AAC.20